MDLSDELGPSVQDQRHRFVFSGTSHVPGNIRVSTIVAVASGRPFNVLAGTDLNGDGDGGALPADRARRIPAEASSHVGRNSGTLPAQITVDVRGSRTFRLTGRVRVDVLAECFNLLNRTNYTEINNVFGAGAFPSDPLPTYGQFQKAGPPRQLQLALRVSF